MRYRQTSKIIFLQGQLDALASINVRWINFISMLRKRDILKNSSLKNFMKEVNALKINIKNELIKTQIRNTSTSLLESEVTKLKKLEEEMKESKLFNLVTHYKNIAKPIKEELRIRK